MSWYIETFGDENWIIESFPSNFKLKDIQSLTTKKGELMLNLSIISNQTDLSTTIKAEYAPNIPFSKNIENIDDFPLIPIYPSSKLLSAEKQLEGKTTKFIATWEVENPISVVDVSNCLMDLSKYSNNWEIVMYPKDPGAEGLQQSIIINELWRVSFLIQKEDIDVTTKINVVVENI
jgi:hypothetical protein